MSIRGTRARRVWRSRTEFRADALELDPARRRALPRMSRSAGLAVQGLLVSAVRACSAERVRRRYRTGSDAGFFRGHPGPKGPGDTGPQARALPIVAAGVVEPLPRKRARPGAGPEARGRLPPAPHDDETHGRR